ncbi:hypothetical protein ACFX1Q_007044 [Malus domestica]
MDSRLKVLLSGSGKENRRCFNGHRRRFCLRSALSKDMSESGAHNPCAAASSLIEAARDYDREARKIRSNKAKVNFPNEDDNLPAQTYLRKPNPHFFNPKALNWDLGMI